jgi:hypothetical protein
VHKLWRVIATVFTVLFSTIAEKNPHKRLALYAPIVFSAARLVVVGMCVIWCIVALSSGIPGWPMAVLGIGLSFALPATSALQASQPADVVHFFETILGRFGVGSNDAYAQTGLSGGSITPEALYPPATASRPDEVTSEGTT